MFRAFQFLRASFVGGGLCTLVACGGAAQEVRPNVILISIDSLRADHLGCYGYERDTSPAIDQLAGEGVLFEDVSSSTSWTLPAHASLFTALPPSIHGAERAKSTLSLGQETLAEALQSEGYHSAGFWSGPYLHPRFGFAQGFDEYVGCASYDAFPDEALASRPGKPAQTQRRANHLSHEDITNPRLFGAAETWLRERDPQSGPFLLFMHVWDVHYDFIPPSPYDTRFDPGYVGPIDGRELLNLQDNLDPADLRHLLALYDGEIAWTDQHLAGFVRLLQELELEENTLLVLTSDHGEEFFEHGRFGHRWTLYEEVLRIPLVLRWPGHLPPGSRCAVPVRLVDVAPTILDLVGAAPLERVLGVSLRPELEGAGVARPILAELHRKPSLGDLRSLREEDWKLIVHDAGQPIGLYRLDSDPVEARDLRLTDSELQLRALARMERMQVVLEALGAQRALGGGAPAAPLSPDLERELRALGYLGEFSAEGDGSD